MSYDVALVDPSSRAVLDFGSAFVEGGTHAIDGTTLCELNITYNYAEVFGGLVRELHGKTASETLDGLRAFTAQWPNALPYTDYWAPTPGNARAAVERLVAFAERHPSGVWEIT